MKGNCGKHEPRKNVVNDHAALPFIFCCPRGLRQRHRIEDGSHGVLTERQTPIGGEGFAALALFTPPCLEHFANRGGLSEAS